MGAFCLHGNLDTCEVCRRELETDDDYAPIPTTGFAHVLPRDWPTFWQSLTPQECAEALRVAPKIAGAWERVDGGLVRYRVGGAKTLIAETWYWSAKAHPEDHWIGVSIKSTDEGRAFCDEVLRDAGWILL